MNEGKIVGENSDFNELNNAIYTKYGTNNNANLWIEELSNGWCDYEYSYNKGIFGFISPSKKIIEFSGSYGSFATDTNKLYTYNNYYGEDEFGGVPKESYYIYGLDSNGNCYKYSAYFISLDTEIKSLI